MYPHAWWGKPSPFSLELLWATCHRRGCTCVREDVHRWCAASCHSVQKEGKDQSLEPQLLKDQLSCAAVWHRIAQESPRKGSLFQLIIYPEAAMLTQIIWAWTYPEDQQSKHLPATLQGLCLHAPGSFALALQGSTERQQGPRGKARTKQTLSGKKRVRKDPILSLFSWKVSQDV